MNAPAIETRDTERAYPLPPDPEVWWFWCANEYLDEGVHPGGATREEAIEDGRSNLARASFYVAQGELTYLGEWMPDAEEILRQAREEAYEAGGEALGDEQVSVEAIAELDALIAGWAEKHLARPPLYQLGTAELVPGEEGSP